MRKVEYCIKCVISNYRASPSIVTKDVKSKNNFVSFKDGVCNACHYVDKKDSIDWDQREKKLLILLDKHRKNNGEYDCIVPGSGGKDSAFQAHILKYKYGMNPLTVTWAPHIYTDIGYKNFYNWLHIGGFDNYLFTPNPKIHSLLTNLSYKNLFNPFQPFIIGQRFLAPKLAKKYNVKLIFYGEHISEYGTSSNQDSSLFDLSYLSVDKIHYDKIFISGVSVSKLIENNIINLKDYQPYSPPLKNELNSLGVEAHFLGYFLKWIPQEVYYYAVKNTGFKPNYERTQGTFSKYNSIDDKLDGFHYWTALLKFGIGRCTHEASQEIRNKHITREEAVNLVKLYDQEFPDKYFDDVLEYMKMTKDEFFKTAKKFRNLDLWYHDSKQWKLKYPIY